MIVHDLLRAVLEPPDDDAPRLVYADALIEAGDPRGELIARQCGCGGIGDAGVVALARSPHVRGLRSLNVFGSKVGVEGIRALIASPIESLDYLGIDADPEHTKLLTDHFGAAALGGT